MNDYEQARKIIDQAQPDTADDGPVVLTHSQAELVRKHLREATEMAYFKGKRLNSYAKAHGIMDGLLVDMENVYIPYGDAKFISHVLERAAFDFRRVGRSLGRILNHD